MSLLPSEEGIKLLNFLSKLKTIDFYFFNSNAYLNTILLVYLCNKLLKFQSKKYQIQIIVSTVKLVSSEKKPRNPAKTNQ